MKRRMWSRGRTGGTGRGRGDRGATQSRLAHQWSPCNEGDSTVMNSNNCNRAERIQRK